VFRSVQQAGRLLFGVQFLLNGGDTHPNLDMVQGGVIEAAELRLRLELGGNLQGAACVAEGREVTLRIGETEVRLSALYAVFAEAGRTDPAWQWEVTREGGILGIDLVIHAGERRHIDFNKIAQAGFLFTLAIGQAIAEVPNAEARKAEAPCMVQIVEEKAGQMVLIAGLEGAAGRMELRLPLVPQRLE
jgi:hypothetical protein